MNIFDLHKPETLCTSLLWEACVDIAEREDLGEGPKGNRAIVPICGGVFRAGPRIEVSAPLGRWDWLNLNSPVYRGRLLR